MHTTPVSLLRRLQGGRGADDWLRFAELYSPLLLYWARQLGLQEADAADLAQDVLARVWQEINSYQRREGKRFRGWLWTITLNRWRQLGRARARKAAPGNGATHAVDDPIREIEEAEYTAYLVNRALQLMKTEFEPTTWKACWEFVAEGRPAQDVAAQLGVTPNAVYQAKARVMRRLREFLDGLID
jgi:RNA polymerase sigma-70 factor (ECF subfamily)